MSIVHIWNATCTNSDMYFMFLVVLYLCLLWHWRTRLLCLGPISQLYYRETLLQNEFERCRHLSGSWGLAKRYDWLHSGECRMFLELDPYWKWEYFGFCCTDFDYSHLAWIPQLYESAILNCWTAPLIFIFYSTTAEKSLSRQSSLYMQLFYINDVQSAAFQCPCSPVWSYRAV